MRQFNTFFGLIVITHTKCICKKQLSVKIPGLGGAMALRLNIIFVLSTLAGGASFCLFSQAVTNWVLFFTLSFDT
jgi:hypothetical protein